MISRLRQQAGLPEDVFFIYPELGLHRWQEEAIEAVTEAAEDPNRRDGRLGIVSMPHGAGKTRFLAALFLRLLQESQGSRTILLLGTSRGAVKRSAERLSEWIGSFYPVKEAESREALIRDVKREGVILVSTVQKLLGQNARSGVWKEEMPFSESSGLFVAAEEISYGWQGQFYHDMRARFPNAVFLGVTNYPSDTSRQQDLFGPFLYRYSHREAFIDGLARHVDYCFAGGFVEEGTPVLSFADGADRLYDRTPEAMRRMAPEILSCLQRYGGETFALLLCQNQSEAAGFFRCLRESFPAWPSDRFPKRHGPGDGYDPGGICDPRVQ